MRRQSAHHGLTLLETAISLVLIAALFSVLVPALTSARKHSFREHCQANQGRIGEAWFMYLAEHNNQFPAVPLQPGWFYGGARFSAVTDTVIPDLNRPLTPYLPTFRTNDTHEIVWCCPADRGVTDESGTLGTGRRTAFQSYGTSYRANAALLQPRSRGDHPSNDSAEFRGLNRSEITTAASRLLLGGDPIWFEVAESTNLTAAAWHGQEHSGNLLFLDGSVRFLAVRPRSVPGPIVFDPVMAGSVGVEPSPIADHAH